MVCGLCAIQKLLMSSKQRAPRNHAGSLTQKGEPIRNAFTKRTESEAVQDLRLERMAAGVTGRCLPGASVC